MGAAEIFAGGGLNPKKGPQSRPPPPTPKDKRSPPHGEKCSRKAPTW